MTRILALLAAMVLLTACTQTRLDEPPEDLGEFRMRVGYVYTDKALQWPMSRDAAPAEWQEPIQQALDARLRRYQGSQDYDVAVTLEGFLLATGGVPVLFNPKSVVVVNVFVRDVAGEKYLVRKKQLQIFEDTTGESAVVGSGYARTKEEQIQGLALNIADAVEELMAEGHKEEGWFAPREAPAAAASAPTG
ncbi:hypothetical protein ACUXV3_11600 [Roseobacteraceae bacterium NS-SX3]